MKSTRKKATKNPTNWEIVTTITVNGREVVKGTELSFKKERGRFRFIRQVTRTDTGVVWIDVWGGPKGSEALRSFYPEKVKTVHRIKITPTAMLEARKPKA